MLLHPMVFHSPGPQAWQARLFSLQPGIQQSKMRAKNLTQQTPYDRMVIMHLNIHGFNVKEHVYINPYKQ